MPTFSFLRSRLARLWASDPDPAGGADVAVARKRGFRPSVRRLEPRLVLNASAELTSLGQLVITGTDAADYVRLDVNSLGQITLQNAFGDSIEIVGNPSGQSEPLNPTDIFSGQIQIDLRGGHDTLDLVIPSGLNVSVIDGAGFDTINIIRPDSLQPKESATHHLAAQAIRFETDGQPLDWRNQNFQLSGNVFVGTSFSPTQTDILIDGGSWEIDGRLILQSDVGFFANTLGGSVDLSNAALTADRPATTLTVDLGNADTAVLQIGNVDDSASHSIESLTVISANSVDLQAANLILPGELSINNVSDAINIDSQISASNISLQASTIQILGTISVDHEFTATSDVLLISGDITLPSGSSGLITLDGTDLVKIDNGAILSIENGTLAIDTEGRVDLADSIVTSDSSDAVISVRGATTITLGDIRIGKGLIDLQTIAVPSPAIGQTIGQAVGTSIVVSKLRISADGDVLLQNSNNDFKILENIITEGDFRIRDDVGDLTIQTMVVSGTTVDVVTDSSLFLLDNAITAQDADVRLQAGLSIINSAVGVNQFNVTSKTLNATAGTGIGGIDPLRTAVDRLTANVLSTGAINIVENDAIELQQVSTDDGPINITANGSITAVDVVSHNRSGLDGAYDSLESRDIKLIATGMTSDIRIVQITANRSADVLLVAGDDVIGISDGGIAEVIADDLEIIAGNATDDGILAISLSTDINDLVFSVNGAGRGDVEIRELNSLSLASSDLYSDAHQLRTNNGEIRIIAGDSIFLNDLDPQNDLQGSLADPEMIAGGDNGRITLIATNKIELGNQTQIIAAQSTPGAVRLESDEVVFGETIEINTGSGVGIARHFLPRPAAEEMETAFYDETTIRTDVLTQENSNDAKGFLTLRVGLPGERGLQVDIDWGAPTNRFQRITNVSADNSRLVDGKLDISGPITDDPLLRVSHVYLESDILDSVLNDRTSATSPLNVRFAVSHHESIIVQAGTVTQGFDGLGEPLSAEIAGRLVSSTDNPLTASVFESGTARFIIPNLTIPVAFFPVRNIIPEPVKLESFARSVETILLGSGSVESESGSASSSATRDEYFQIRILSPDPTGEDLADPKRLPDDILSGDKLQRLFENLPDGRYEVGYVFGDGNVRSLLMIDNRDGETKVLGQEIKGGPLRLERLSPSEIDLQPLPVDPSQSDISVDSNDDRERNGKESPDVEDQGFRSTPTPSESLATGTIVGGLLMDATINRYSIVGRYLSRRRKDNCPNTGSV